MNVDVATLRVGDRVHYIPSHDENDYENGIIKRIIEPDSVWVVYHCDGNWKHYKDYTAQLTHVTHLRKGWRHDDEPNN